MARKPPDWQRLQALLDRFEPTMRKAFTDAVDDLRDGINLAELIRALESGDVEAALRVMNIDAAAFRQLRRVIDAVFVAAGEEAIAALPALIDWSGARITVRFDPDYPRAAAWVSRHSSNLITAIVDDQRNSIRAALESGLRSGTAPRTVALDIVGRVDQRTGRRAGGIVGITSGQREFVVNARNELLSGDPSLMRKYLGRKARIRSFDATVRKAIEAKLPVEADAVSKITARYHDSLLKMRGDTIARTETAAAASAARQEGREQAYDAAGITDEMIERTWRVRRDGRERASHHPMHGQTVQGRHTPFISGAGNRLMRPHDPQAAASETVGCRCGETVRIKWDRRK